MLESPAKDVMVAACSINQCIHLIFSAVGWLDHWHLTFMAMALTESSINSIYVDNIEFNIEKKPVRELLTEDFLARCVACQITIPACMLVTELASSQGAFFMIDKTLSNNVERRCSMTVGGPGRIVPGKYFYFYVAILTSKAVNQAKFTIVTSMSKASTCIIRAKDDEECNFKFN